MTHIPTSIWFVPRTGSFDLATLTSYIRAHDGTCQKIHENKHHIYVTPRQLRALVAESIKQFLIVEYIFPRISFPELPSGNLTQIIDYDCAASFPVTPEQIHDFIDGTSMGHVGLGRMRVFTLGEGDLYIVPKATKEELALIAAIYPD